MDCDLPINLTGCEAWADYSTEIQDLATALATTALRSLTGFRVGNCPVTLRPCGERCAYLRTWQTYPVSMGGSWAGAGGGFTPTVIDGSWYNVGCGCGGSPCSCTRLCEISLPGGISGPISVLMDGVLLPVDAFRVDNGNLLVRTDGECWPVCQDMAAPTTDIGTWAVTFTPGLPLDAAGQIALGILACEYAQAASGQACRLPSNALQVQRLGVTIDLARQSFPEGLTGIPEVDLVLRRYNPYALAAPSMVWSPDVRRGRTTTWPVS